MDHVLPNLTNTAHKMKFSVKDFFSKCDLKTSFVVQCKITFTVLIQIFSDQCFPVPGQNCRFCPYTGKSASEKTGILTYFTQCLPPESLRNHSLILCSTFQEQFQILITVVKYNRK